MRIPHLACVCLLAGCSDSLDLRPAVPAGPSIPLPRAPGSVTATPTETPVDTGVSSLQSGTATMPVGASASTQTLDVPISAVDTSRSVLFFTLRVDSLDPGDGMVSGQLTSPTNVRFLRGDDTSLSAVTVRWHVLEFTDGVRVQRGAASVTDASTTFALATPVDVSHSFTLHSCSAPGNETAYEGNDYFRVRLSATSLRIDATGLSVAKVCEWQVVEHAGATVQRGIGSLATMDTQTGNIPISPVDEATSFVQVTWRSDSVGGAATGPDFLRAQIGFDSVQLDRGVAGSTIDYSWEVVSFADGTSVQTNNAQFGAGELDVGQTILGVDTARSIAILSGNQRGGRHAFTGDDAVGPGWFSAILTSPTQVRVERAVSGSVSARGTWFVIQFP